MQAMPLIVKPLRRPPTGRSDDRNAGFPRLSDVVAHSFRCTRIATPRAPNRKPWKAVSIGHYLCRLVNIHTKTTLYFLLPWQRLGVLYDASPTR